MKSIERIAVAVIVIALVALAAFNIQRHVTERDKTIRDALSYSQRESKRADSLLTLANAAQTRSTQLTGEINRLKGVVTTLDAANQTLRKRVYSAGGTKTLPDTCKPLYDLVDGLEAIVDTLKQIVSIQDERHASDSVEAVNLRASLLVQTTRADSVTRVLVNLPKLKKCGIFGIPCPSRKQSFVTGIIIGSVASIYGLHLLSQ